MLCETLIMVETLKTLLAKMKNDIRADLLREIQNEHTSDKDDECSQTKKDI